MMHLDRPLRIAVVAPVMVRFDAISMAARDTVRTFAGDPRFEVAHFGCTCSYPDVIHRPCGDVSELLLDPIYQGSDVAIFHFGIHHSLFNALLAGGPPLRIVSFHNVTPPHLVNPSERPAIERSLLQIHTLRHADEIWADSPTNARDLLALGFDPSRISVVPIAVEDPEPAELGRKVVRPVHVLFISRIAQSKGLHDLVTALAHIQPSPDEMRVTVAGNTAWSDPAYLVQVRDLIRDHGLETVIRFRGTIDDAERERLFHSAHVLAMPSYHEGFCRPVVEGVRGGCIPVVYDGYNLPNVAAGLGRVVTAGDVRALAAAIGELAAVIPDAIAQPRERLLPIDRGLTSVEEFSSLAADYVPMFSFESVARQKRRRLLQVWSEWNSPHGAHREQTSLLPHGRRYELPRG